jgi:hypothetical protein
VRETITEKGKRYLGEGRLIVRELDEQAGTVQADCRGAGAVYVLGHDENGRWFCSCPARQNCGHLEALRLIVAIEKTPR